MQSPEINLLAEALSKAQSEISGAHKDATNPHFKSKYADLESVWDACRVPLSKNGLSIVQSVHRPGNELILRTTLCHTSGQFFYSEIPVIMTKVDMQGMGSAITYARRYGLSAIVGVCPSDDDANAAVGYSPQNQNKGQQKAPVKSTTAISTKNSSDLSIQNGNTQQNEEKKKKVIWCEKIQSLLLKFYPSTSKEDKLSKVTLIEQFFGTSSWTEVENMNADVLKTQFEKLAEHLMLLEEENEMKENNE